MSDKLPAVKPKQLRRVLERQGWRLNRVTGSHHIFEHADRQATVSVPMHSRDMKTGTLNRILRDAEIDRDEFRRLL